LLICCFHWYVQELAQLQATHEQVIRKLEESHLQVTEQLREQLCQMERSENALSSHVATATNTKVTISVRVSIFAINSSCNLIYKWNCS
jgi:hypothetical protein